MMKLKLLFRNKKFIRTFIIVLLLLVAVSIILGVRLSNKGQKIEVVKVKKGNVAEYYSTKGMIESNGQNSYVVLDGTKVEELYVKVGDSVKKGELLATFDTSGSEKLVKEQQDIYNEAVNQYYKVSRSIDAARTQVANLDTKISKIENSADNLKDNLGQSTSSNAKQEISSKELKAALDTLSGGDSSLSDKEIEQLLKDVESNDNKIKSDYDVSDINNIIDSGSTLENELLSLELQLDLMKAQKNTLETTISQTYIDGYKAAVDSSKKVLEEMKSQKKDLDEGWEAKTDGVVLELNLKEGEVYNQGKVKEVDNENLAALLQKLYNSNVDINDISEKILSSQSTYSGVGMVINNFKNYFVKFDIGKYDTQRIKLGMDAKIDFLSNDYKGDVSYIGSKAADSSSGLSVITGGNSSSSNKLPAKVTISNPDKNLILGFDVKVKIKTKEVKDALVIPIECLMGDSKKSYVYVYNDINNSIDKRVIKVGLSSDDNYEVKSGLKKGEKVVKNFSEEMDQDEKFYVGD